MDGRSTDFQENFRVHIFRVCLSRYLQLTGHSNVDSSNNRRLEMVIRLEQKGLSLHNEPRLGVYQSSVHLNNPSPSSLVFSPNLAQFHSLGLLLAPASTLRAYGCSTSNDMVFLRCPGLSSEGQVWRTRIFEFRPSNSGAELGFFIHTMNGSTVLPEGYNGPSYERTPRPKCI